MRIVRGATARSVAMARVDTDSRKRGKEEEKRMTSNKVMRLMYDLKELLTQGIASMTGAPLRQKRRTLYDTAEAAHQVLLEPTQLTGFPGPPPSLCLSLGRAPGIDAITCVSVVLGHFPAKWHSSCA